MKLLVILLIPLTCFCQQQPGQVFSYTNTGFAWNTTYLSSVSASTNERVFSNTGLSIAVNAGDYIEIKSVNPTWATNPLTTIFGGYIYVE